MEITIRELVQNYKLYNRMYSGVKTKDSIDKALDISRKTIKPMNEVIEEVESLKKLYQQEIDDAKEKDKKDVESRINKEFNKKLSESVDIDFVKIKKEHLADGDFNPFELSLIEKFIDES